MSFKMLRHVGKIEQGNDGAGFPSCWLFNLSDL